MNTTQEAYQKNTRFQRVAGSDGKCSTRTSSLGMGGSTIVLLRPAADGPDIKGIYERRYRNGDVYDWFRYDVVRIWEHPVEEILASGLPVLPLAPVASD
jgi:hypothetical protein